MTYEEIVLKVREGFENSDAREIFEHVAVQVNIEGEGSGAFYIEVADRYVSVEPYDYYDRDGLLTTDAETLIALAENRLSMREAYESGAVKVQGNLDKLRMLLKIKLKEKEKKTKAAADKEAKSAAKKTAGKKAATEKKEPEKVAKEKAEPKKTAAKNTEAPKKTAKQETK